jgi:hypothetical protein
MFFCQFFSPLIFLLGYIRCTGGIHCDNSKSAYIVHWLDHLLCLSPSTPSHPTSSNCKRFLCSVSHKYMKSIHHIPSSQSPSFTLPPHKSPPPTHTVPILQSCLLLLIFKSNVQRGFSMYPCCESTLLWSIQPLPLLSLTPLPPTQLFFSNFQCTSLYPLPAQMLHFPILLMPFAFCKATQIHIS